MKAPASATGFWAMSRRCRVLLHLIDATCEHAGKAYKTVRTELDAYEGDLANKIEIVALNKIDAVTPDELKKQKDRLEAGRQKDAAAGLGRDRRRRARSAEGAGRVIGEAPVSLKAKGGVQTAEPWAPANPQG